MSSDKNGYNLTALNRHKQPIVTTSPVQTITASKTEDFSRLLKDLSKNVEFQSAFAPSLLPEQLGDPQFCKDHSVRYAYATGSMANGIASVALVNAAAKSGLLSFFGAAGLGIDRVEEAILSLKQSLGLQTHGFNLIHSPNDQALENALCELYLRRQVHLVEASAFMGLTPAIVRYRLTGLRRLNNGQVFAPNKIVAKVSRAEVAEKFLSPASESIRRELVSSNLITTQEAELGTQIPMAQDVTVEADSGGHTDNRALVALLPSILSLRDRLQQKFGYDVVPRIGAAGGISTPSSVAAAYLMGAAYVMTGSINQACVESGTSDIVRQMLSQAGQADVAMAPAADMFEMGVKVQILKRGTMFAMRAAKLYEIYRSYDSINSIPTTIRHCLEKDLFRDNLDSVWEKTRDYFTKRDPEQVTRAESDPKYKMSLIFRSYLGQASRWANAGVSDRVLDYQIWCGPAMGAFNEWTQGTFLANPQNRKVDCVALNLLYGAAYLTRICFLRSQGAIIPNEMSFVSPQTMDQLKQYLDPQGRL